MKFQSPALFIAAAIFLLGAYATAQEPTEALQKKATSVYQEILSPFCPGRSLNDCPSSKAHELKTEIIQKLQSGVPEEQVLEEVFSSYGDQYRAIPRYAGFGRLVWLAPATFLLAGLFWAFAVMSKKKRSMSAIEAGKAPALEPQLAKQIEEELSTLD
jgi:cytochrome c-type biogenesis protein CcmH/NrfF